MENTTKGEKTVEFLSFLKECITNPRTVGAVLPSSKYLARKMTASIDFDKAEYVAEYGPGTGVFTEHLLSKRKKDTVVLLFETNDDFYEVLKKKYRHKTDFYLINDSAEQLEKYMMELDIPRLDYIVSGLPFASLPQQVSSNILAVTQKQLRQGGAFITFQYTLLKKDFITRYFPNIEIAKEVRNVPPAYVFSCRV